MLVMVGHGLGAASDAEGGRALAQAGERGEGSDNGLWLFLLWTTVALGIYSHMDM